METESGVVRFRLPVSWDIASRVLKHAARNGRTSFHIHRHGNGYLRLELPRTLRPAVSVDVMFLAERDSASTVLVVDVTRGPRFSKRNRQRVDALLEQFRSDAEFFAARLECLDEPAQAQALRDRLRPSWEGSVEGLRGASQSS